MQIKLATWNLCLGLFHKKDYVQMILQENEIDVLTLQETELPHDIDIVNLNLKGYTIKTELNDKKLRVATYIKNDTNKVRSDKCWI